MAREHSAVCYVYDPHNNDFRAEEKAKPISNTLGLDIFEFRDSAYEGRSGARLCPMSDIPFLNDKIKWSGGMEKLQTTINQHIEKHGLSPRYTRPNEKKSEVFPPKEKDENLIMATEVSGLRHRYFRFYNENGIELYTRANAKDFFATVFAPCKGYMVPLSQKNRLEELINTLSTLPDGIYGEIERMFNKDMADPGKWVDYGFARVLDRLEEAEAHNKPIIEQRRQERADREAERRARERAEQQRIEESVRKAENDLLDGKEVVNTPLDKRSLVLQLFRNYEIELPLQTKGWINNSLQSFSYDGERLNVRHSGTMSEKFPFAVSQLRAAILTKQQFEEYAPGNEPIYTDTESETEEEI